MDSRNGRAQRCTPGQRRQEPRHACHQPQDVNVRTCESAVSLGPGTHPPAKSFIVRGRAAGAECARTAAPSGRWRCWRQLLTQPYPTLPWLPAAHRPAAQEVALLKVATDAALPYPAS